VQKMEIKILQLRFSNYKQGLSEKFVFGRYKSFLGGMKL